MQSEVSKGEPNGASTWSAMFLWAQGPEVLERGEGGGEMKVRMYVDLIENCTHESAANYGYASSRPTQQLTPGYRRFWFDLDFPPGTFVEDRSTQLPSAMAKEMPGECVASNLLTPYEYFTQNLDKMKYTSCIECEQTFSNANVHTLDGWGGTQISGLCEICFDELMEDYNPDDD
jgi:hypothetical protein